VGWQGTRTATRTREPSGLIVGTDMRGERLELVAPGPLGVRQPAVQAGEGFPAQLSFAAVLDEIEALPLRARAHGGGSVEEPVDTPWNTRDLTTTDPDGNVVVFTAARPPESEDAAFSQQMVRWSTGQGLLKR
jgi:uncharacterized glyoxalase superfamily protein PhnB